MRTIYLDYNATTPLDPAVRNAMLPFLDQEYGNPSSIHHVGRRARALLDDARDRVAAIWRCKSAEVVFTSGGTEANNLAIFGAARARRDKGRHLITSRIEHPAVLHCCEQLERREGFQVTYLPVDQHARISIDALRAAIRPDTTLVSLMAANNEVGTVQPVAALGALCRERGILFHTDAVQWFGKEPFASIHQFNADLVSCCAHKFHGPKGAGGLFIRSPLQPEPILFGGAHENERRAGTENVAAIAGFARATELFLREPVFPRSSLLPLATRLTTSLGMIPGCRLLSTAPETLANTITFSVADSDSLTLLANLDLAGVCASSGSACSAGSLLPSHVVSAMGFTAALAASLVRFSMGRHTSAAEVDDLILQLPTIVKCSKDPR